MIFKESSRLIHSKEAIVTVSRLIAFNLIRSCYHNTILLTHQGIKLAITSYRKSYFFNTKTMFRFYNMKNTYIYNYV